MFVDSLYPPKMLLFWKIENGVFDLECCSLQNFCMVKEKNGGKFKYQAQRIKNYMSSNFYYKA